MGLCRREHHLAGGFRSGSRRSDLRGLGRSDRPRTGRETSRNNANQRELLSTSKGRPEAVSRRLRRSWVWGASIWGTEGPEFKSRQPDKQIPSLNRRFDVSGVPAGHGTNTQRTHCHRPQVWCLYGTTPDRVARSCEPGHRFVRRFHHPVGESGDRSGFPAIEVRHRGRPSRENPCPISIHKSNLGRTSKG